MPGPTQFRQYLIAQDAEGSNVEVVRTAEQVGVLAFDIRRLMFVHCHVLLEGLSSRRSFDDRARKFKACGHPRLARLIESGEDEGSAFYITANVDGETLRGYLSRHEQIPVWLAMRLASSALEAVRAAIDVGDFLPLQLMDVLRMVQTGPLDFQVMLTDYRLADPPGAKSARARLAKAAFDKQEQFLGVFFLERLQTAPSPQNAMLNARDFAELLENLLTACGPGVDAGIENVLSALAKSTPAPPAGEIAAQFKSKPLLAALLPGFNDVARSVSGQVRVQSQKIDAAHPYAIRGSLARGGQEVIVEPVPPPRLVGAGPAGVMRQVLNLPKTGKFPNLVPVNFVEENEGVLCVAETAVEGVALSDLLSARGTLDPQETYLVLAGMDAALSQLEKTNLETRRLRLEDIFLFTGFSKGPLNESGLLSKKLNEWPGFSVVLRAHPCLGSMSGRGTDPGMLLPPELKTKAGTEPVWNGAWMAALGCFLSGMTSGIAARHASGVAEFDATLRMFEDELARGRKNSPSSRSGFLSRYARVMQHHDLAQPDKGDGFWAELSGSGAAQDRAAEISQAVSAPPVEKAPPAAPLIIPAAPPPPDEPMMGFAEALIQRAHLLDEEPHPAPGLRPLRGGDRTPVHDVESSWRPMHRTMPLWVRGLLFAGGSVALGAALAHLSGRALWQDPRAAMLTRPGEQTSLSSTALAMEPTGNAPAKMAAGTPMERLKLVPSAPPLTAVDLQPKRPAGAPVPVSMSPRPRAAATGTASQQLNDKLLELRKTGGRLPAELQAATDKAARAGNTEAMLALGRMNLRGESGSVDEQTAFTWFNRAMSAGDTAATVPLAECYLQGWGTPADPALAVDLLGKAVASGDIAAKDLLGVCYARGFGVQRDDQKAFALCSEAYAGGSVTACGNLGAMYLRGQGVAQNAERAVQLFAEGARRGHPESMLLYAQSLEYGTGTPADRAEASQWYGKAARVGNAEAANWCREKGVSY